MRPSLRVFVAEGALNASHELPDAVRTELLDLSSELEAVGPLIDKLSVVDPDEVELRAIAATLHAFYNGVERAFTIIAKHFGESPGQSHAWHRDLLLSMAAPTGSRSAVIDGSVRDRLRDYLGFRHFFRHAYPMRLKWELLRPMVHDLRRTHEDVETSVEAFLESITIG